MASVLVADRLNKHEVETKMKVRATKYIHSETKFARVEYEFEMEALPPIGYFLGTSDYAAGRIRTGYIIFANGEWIYRVELDGYKCDERFNETVRDVLKVFVDDGWEFSNIMTRS